MRIYIPAGVNANIAKILAQYLPDSVQIPIAIIGGIAGLIGIAVCIRIIVMSIKAKTTTKYSGDIQMEKRERVAIYALTALALISMIMPEQNYFDSRGRTSYTTLYGDIGAFFLLFILPFLIALLLALKDSYRKKTLLICGIVPILFFIVTAIIYGNKAPYPLYIYQISAVGLIIVALMRKSKEER